MTGVIRTPTGQSTAAPNATVTTTDLVEDVRTGLHADALRQAVTGRRPVGADLDSRQGGLRHAKNGSAPRGRTRRRGRGWRY
jgi:hypothetical protein